MPTRIGLPTHLFAVVLLAGLVAALLPGAAALAQSTGPEWAPLGPPAFSPAQAYYTRIAVDGQGAAYVLFMDFANARRASVMRFDGAAWQVAGAAGFSSGQIQAPALALAPSGTAYAAYVDQDQGYKVAVMRNDGAGWQPVGGPAVSPTDADYVSLAVDRDNVPYVAYMDGSADYKATVMRFDGAAWQPVGGPGLSTGEAAYLSLALDGRGRPYLAYADGAAANRLTLVRYDDDSRTWQVVGAAGFSAGQARSTALALDGQDIPYIAYRDAANAGKATVMTYAETAGWQPVGAAGFSTGAADYVSLTLDGQGLPYVAYKDGAAAGRATVMHYTAAGGWQPLGPTGFSGAGADYVSLALDGQGTPYVAYTDWQNGGKATAMVFGSDRTPPVVTLTPDPAAQVAATGWYNLASSGTQGLRVDVSARDPSGVAAITCRDGGNTVVLDVSTAAGSFVLGDGDHTLACAATDRAGNSGAALGSSAMPARLAVDQAPPVAQGSAAPAADAHGWHNSTVTVTFVGDDGAGSGIAGCTTTTLAAEGRDQAAEGTCTDHTGNVSGPAPVSNISIDLTAPVIAGSRTPPANASGWNDTDVTVAFTCAEAGLVQSGLDENSVAGATLGTEGADQALANTGTCTDLAGNAAAPVTVSGINIDKTPPVLAGVPDDARLAGTAEGAIFSYALPTAADNLDPTPGVTCAPASGTLFPPGTTTVACTAEDAAGNLSHGSFNVTVLTGVTIRLLDSAGQGLAGAKAQYYYGGWRNLPGSTDEGGNLVANLGAIGNPVKFRLTYAYADQEKAQDVSSDPVVVFRTVNVRVELKDSAGNLLPDAGGAGRAAYHVGGAWHDLGPTTGGQVDRELLPLAYPFAMEFAHARQVKLQNVAAAPTVVFQTARVTVELRDSGGNLLPDAAGTGQVQYHTADGWHDLGRTTGGRASKELLPVMYAFSLRYAHGQQEKLQMTGLNASVVFKTTLVTIELRDRAGSLVPDSAGTGRAQYYAAGAWRDLGRTSGGRASKELLPMLYNFSLDYAGQRQEKWQWVTLKPTVVFKIDGFRWAR